MAVGVCSGCTVTTVTTVGRGGGAAEGGVSGITVGKLADGDAFAEQPIHIKIRDKSSKRCVIV